MLKQSSKLYIIPTIAIMSTLAIILNHVPSLQLLWQINIDFVGTALGLSYFLYGLSTALPVSILTSIYIIISSTTGLVGGTMKFISTVPMFIVPALLTHLPFYPKISSNIPTKVLQITINSILSNAIRLLITTIMNLYWVLPAQLRMATQSVLTSYGGIIPLITFIARLDVPQGIVDILAPWTLAFIVIPWIQAFKLKRKGKTSTYSPKK